MKPVDNNRWIDTNEFARRGSELSAVQPVAEFDRLRELLAGDEGQITWSLSGERQVRPDEGVDLFMRLQFAGDVSLPCVRCLQPVVTHVTDERLFKLAVTESMAEREDRDAEEYDVLATSARFDVLELVEDEVIMGLPIAPRHDHCELPAQQGAQPVADDQAGQPERPNPFAVLARLRRPDGSDDG